MAFNRSRMSHLGPRSLPLPVLWTLAVDDTTVDEGATATYTLSCNRQGKAAVAMSIHFRRPTTVGGIPIVATDADFDQPLLEALQVAVTATTGASLTSVASNDFRVSFSTAWNGTFTIPLPTLNNPAEQGNRLAGLEVFTPSQGTLVVAAVSFTIVDVTVASAPPVNTAIPLLSDATPRVGTSLVVSGTGTWTNDPTGYLYKWQTQSTVAQTFIDNFNRANELLTANANYTLGMGTAANVSVASSGIAFAAVDGTVVLVPDLGDTNHYIQAKATTSATNRYKLYVKWVNSTNYILFRIGTTDYEIRVRAGGGEVVRMTVAHGTLGQPTYRLECNANVVRLLKDGVVTGTPYTLSAGEITALSASSRAGVGTGPSAASPGLDDLEHGTFTVGSPVSNDIASAESASFIPTTAELGLLLRAGVRAFNGAGPATDYVYTDWTSAVSAAAPVPVNSVAPQLSASVPQEGVALSCSTGTWTNSPTGYAYQWQKGTTDISAATSAAYTPVNGDIGSTLRCRVTASNGSGSGTGVFSAASSAVIAAGGSVTIPVNTVVPVLSTTTPVVGAAVTCGTGTWTQNPTSFAYQWQKVTTNIGGATSASYTPVSGDIGSTLRCQVTATNSAGPGTPQFSASSSAVAAAPVPVNTVAPVLSSTTPAVGTPLSSGTGTWTNNPTSFAYKWQQLISAVWTDIASATSSTYIPVSGNNGRELRCGVLASNAAGPAAAYTFSAQTSAVTTPSGGGTLTAATLNGDDLAYVLVGAATDTVVGTFVGVGATITTATLLATWGGAYKIAGSSPTFQLKVAAVSPTFEVGNAAVGVGPGNSKNTISVRFTGPGGASFDKLFDIFPIFAKVEPTGDATNTVVNPSFTGTGLNTQFQSTLANRTITVQTSNIGVVMGTGALVDCPRTNSTFIGHPRFINRQDGIIRVRGQNLIFRDWNFQPGVTHALAQPSGQDIDAVAVIGNITVGGGAAENILFENCVFGQANDELASVIAGADKFPRNIRFYRCAFLEPLKNAGNPKDNPHGTGNHAFGPMAYSNTMNVVFEKCWIHNGRYRAIMVKHAAKGVTMRNCLISHYDGDGDHGPTITAPDNAGDPAQTTAVFEANLYHLINALAILQTIHIRGAGIGTKIYVPQSGSYMNHYIWRTSPTGLPTFASDPITIGNGIYFDRNSPTSTIVNYRPFKLVDDVVMPTGTAVEREALFNDILDYVGCRNRDGGGALIAGDSALNKYQYDIIHAYRLSGSRGTNRGTTQVQPSDLATWYGSTWASGGTLGAMTDAAP